MIVDFQFHETPTLWGVGAFFREWESEDGPVYSFHLLLLFFELSITI